MPSPWAAMKTLPSYHDAAPGFAHLLEKLYVPPPEGREVSAFDSRSRASVSPTDFLARMIKYSNCSPSAVVTLFILVDRFTLVLRLDHLNMHRVMAAALPIAAKLTDDVHYSNGYYAKICGLSTEELCQLEHRFLCAIEFKVAVSARRHAKVVASVADYVRRNELTL
eukprot:TRINITY_DN60266_c0_g1_i1.p1 TRINITY_DN60266_c0_g1~~TRINITY_DN60266_c0_g1_i1.p1  ORF type:complete len:167 (+),score=51.43 TRINITY_DN60266_c0_g1_i1:74-574(+)